MKTGLINFYKESKHSSARAINRLKRFFPRKTKIGHAGTLDPFATGVLLVLIGKATKSSEIMMSLPKQYIANIKLGATTITDDIESDEIVLPVFPMPNINEIEKAVQAQTGMIMQKPPAFSALKIGGMRACDRVRMGEQIDLPARQVQVYSIEIVDYTWPMLKIKVDCGRGTYIRSMARDIGSLLGTGGYLTSLERTKIGDHTIENAVRLDDITLENIDQLLIPLSQDFPVPQSFLSQPLPDPHS